eukprot:COSAG03_NODE_4244_length_1624_cov_3.055082_1_plen_133_part_00
MTTTLGMAAVALLAVLTPTPTVGQETLCGGSPCESCGWEWHALVGASCASCPQGGCAEAVALLDTSVKGHVSIPSTYKTVGMGAFYRNTELTSLTWPASVTKIDKGAFSGCSNLQYVNLGDSSVVEIKREAL